MKTGMCPNMRRQAPTHTQCIPMASSDQPSLHPVQSGRGPFPAAAAMSTHGTGLQQPGRCAEAQGKGSRTDRHSLGWTGPAGWVIAECPWLLGTSGSISSPACPSSLPARAGLLCLWAGEGTVDLQRGKETAVQLIQNNDILQNRHISYNLCAI